ncbi:MAG: hypothetical protein KGJ51_09720 [Acidobacteriota bacterium]|nr:hypothetical protein [Acidobacteriota bacterium]MDE3163611.1 hypothetical protein [Acidobacteriota bacterium]
MAERDDFDRMLDAALATYANPDSGLEERILARVEESAPVRAHRPLWLWAGGFAVIVAAFFFFVPAIWHRSPAPQAGPGAHTSIATLPPDHSVNSAPASPAAHPHRVAMLHPVPRPAALPKLSVFPAPAPLSPAEQALVRVVAQSSEDQRRALLAAQHEHDTPIRISAISIPPISPPAEGQE